MHALGHGVTLLGGAQDTRPAHELHHACMYVCMYVCARVCVCVRERERERERESVPVSVSVSVSVCAGWLRRSQWVLLLPGLVGRARLGVQ